MNDLDQTTFARFAERFARIERRVPEPPFRELAIGSRRSGGLSPILAVGSLVVLLAGVLGLAMLGALPTIDGDPDRSPSMLPTPWSPTPSSPTSTPGIPVQVTLLRGRILDAEGNPIRQAKVTAYLQPTPGELAGNTTTDADGRWSITLPSGITYCLELRTDIPVPGDAAPTRFAGYFGPSGMGQPADVCLEPASEVAVDLELPAMRLVSGTIVDETGDPITMAEAGGPFTRAEITVTTMSMGSVSEPNADGRFSMWVPEGASTAFTWVFRDEQVFMSPTTPLVVGADPVTGFLLTVDTGRAVID